MTGLERSQNDIGRHGASTEHVVANGVRDGGEHGAKAGPYRWLAHPPRADWRFRIGNIERRVLHGDWNVQDGQRLVVMKPRRKRHAVALVVHRLRRERVTDSQTAAAEDLAAKTAGIHDGADVGDGRVINQLHRSGLDRKSTRLNSSHLVISYAVFCLKKKTTNSKQRSHATKPL